jgi:hypothetical protein
MIDIFKLLESQGYRHGGPIRYFYEGGDSDGGEGGDNGGAAGASSPGPSGGSAEGNAARGGDNFGGTGSNTPGPSSPGPDGGSPEGNAARGGENFGGMGSNTPGINGNPGSSVGGEGSASNGDDGSIASSEPSTDRSFTLSSEPAAYSNVKPGEDAFAQYGSTTATNIHNQAEQATATNTSLAEILGREPNYGELSQLNDSGMGSMMGVNPNNPTQSVNEMLAAQDLGNFAEKYAVPALSALVPGFAMAYNLAQVASGQVTVGQALTSFAMSYAGKALGVSPSVLGSMIAGNFGQAAASKALGSVTQGIAKASSIPGGLVAFGLNASGAGKAIGNAINSTIGNTGMGISTSSIAKSIDNAVSSIGGAITGSPTTAGTTGTGAQPLSLDPIDNILNSSSNAPTVNNLVPSIAPITSTTTTSATPSASTPSVYDSSSNSFAIPVNTAAATPYNGAEIDYLYDVGGSNIFAPQKAGTPKPDVLKYLQDNVATAAQGGSISDLLDYVRK